MSNILELKNVSKSFKGFELKNINLTLERGYIMGFIGPNGAGKSTTIKLIMNLLRKDNGTIQICGKDYINDELAVKEKIGFVYDENYYYEELTIQEMKNFIKPFYQHWDGHLFSKYVQYFNLPLKKPIKQLSKGMKMKFSLAIALSHHAELLIMDEPTSGLDPLVRSEFLEILQSIMEDENKSIFLSTHITSDLDKIADYITFIHNGEIVLSKMKDELIEEYCIVKGSKEKLSGINESNLLGLKVNEFGFEALSNKKNEIRRTLGDSVLIEKPTVEDIIVFSTRRSDSVVSSY